MKQNRTILAALAVLALSLTACQEEPVYYSFVDQGGDGEERPSVGFDENGASKMTFSVADMRSVRFSKGNLQCKPFTHTWRFANSQYSYIGLNDTNTASHYDDWIDLFGWATSGYDSGAPAFEPFSLSTDYMDYVPGITGTGEDDLSGGYSNCDWGIYNAISNGGGRPGMWRTLTSKEWQYLFSYGDYANFIRQDKWALGTIAGTFHGVILLPDIWNQPTGLEFVPGLEDGWNTNNYGIDDWTQMEEAGAVFLPASGRRTSNRVSFTEIYGDYWSATHYNIEKCFSMNFGRTFLDADRTSDRSMGFAVRLVMDI